MRVFVLYHADIEDDRYVRGIYQRREDAKADLTVEPVEWAAVTVRDKGPYCTTRLHSDACCYVEKWDVLERPTGAKMLPWRYMNPYDVALISPAVEQALLDFMTDPSPYRKTDAAP